MTPQQQLELDGLPTCFIRPPETDDQVRARRRRTAKTLGPERKLKDPSKCRSHDQRGRSLTVPPGFLKRYGAQPQETT